PRGVQHSDLRDHGDRASHSAGRPVRQSVTGVRDMQRVSDPTAKDRQSSRSETIAFVVLLVALMIAPAFVYPIFLMKALCFALFACAFNLLIGYVGLLSFGHALFFGWAAYLSAHLAKIGTLSFPIWLGKWHWLTIPLPPLSPELAILGGMLFATLLGL